MFTEDELATLNTYLNGEEHLPVEIEVLNVKLREHFQQDTSVETPEVEAAIVEESVAEPTVDDAPTEEAPVEAAPPDEAVPADDGAMIQAQDPATSE